MFDPRLETARPEEMVDISAEVQRLIDAAGFQDEVVVIHYPHAAAA